MPNSGHSSGDGSREECWHMEEYGSHCWRPIPNALPHETAERCDVCGETRGTGAVVTPDTC